jgi:hypothetical protein
MAQARFIKIIEGSAPHVTQHLYRVTPPMRNEYTERDHEFVVVSASMVPYTGPETYIFPADEEGHIIDWMEMDGSYRGGLNHAEALSRAGYVVTSE